MVGFAGIILGPVQILRGIYRLLRGYLDKGRLQVMGPKPPMVQGTVLPATDESPALNTGATAL
jgi:hypothetical protein